MKTTAACLFTAAIALVSVNTGALAQAAGDIVFKISNGRVEKYTLDGIYRGSVTNDAVDVDYNGETVVVVKTGGQVERYDYSGIYRGTVARDALRARIHGGLILVTQRNGSVAKYTFNGIYRGSF